MGPMPMQLREYGREPRNGKCINERLDVKEGEFPLFGVSDGGRRMTEVYG